MAAFMRCTLGQGRRTGCRSGDRQNEAMSIYTLRAAEPRDVPAIVGLIEELAEFENLTHLLRLTPETLHPHLFGDKPVVEAAETTSKARSRKARFSVSIKMKVPVITQNSAITVTANARKIMLASMLRPNKTGWRCWRKKVRVATSNTMKAVSLIPPPVEPLPAPMNIKVMMKNAVTGIRLAVSIVIKPDERGATA